MKGGAKQSGVKRRTNGPAVGGNGSRNVLQLEVLVADKGPGDKVAAPRRGERRETGSPGHALQEKRQAMLRVCPHRRFSLRAR